jgi:predicted protein tyrosine phosphatase
MNNRKHNSKNPYQGPKERVLCLCSAGLLRSPTVAFVMAQKGYNTRSAGLETDFALIPVDDVLYHWADLVVTMNDDQAEKASKAFSGPIYNFVIPDNFAYMDDELVEIIESRLKNMEYFKYN